VNTSLGHLPEHKQKQLREIAGIIVKVVDPEKVILFGSDVAVYGRCQTLLR
jgi:hypothetical protein